MVELYSKDSTTGKTWSNTPINITDAVEVSTKHGKKINMDSFSLKLVNWTISLSYGNLVVNKYSESGISESITIKIDDRIKIYAWNVDEFGDYADPNFDDVIIFDGIVTNFSYEEDDNGDLHWAIKGNNATEALLRGYQPARYNANLDKNTVPEIIQDLLLLLNGNKPHEKKIFWHPDNPTTGEYVPSDPSLAKDGWKIINYYKKYTPVYELIEDLLSEKYLGDGNGDYYVFVSTEKLTYGPYANIWTNYLVFKKSNYEDEPSSSLVEGEDLLTARIEKGTWDMVNAVFMDAGDDPRDHAVHAFYFNQESMAKLGAKYKYKTTDDAPNLILSEHRANPSAFESHSEFPKPALYPYTTVKITASAIKDLSSEPSGPIAWSTGAWTGHHIIVADDGEWVDMVRWEAKNRAMATGFDIVKLYGKPRYKFSCKLSHGRRDIKAGEVIKLVMPTFGWFDETGKQTWQKLRVDEVKQQLNKNGWSTTLSLTQDWELATTGEEVGA